MDISYSNFDMLRLYNPDAIVAYFLGFFWGDGCIQKDKRCNSVRSSIEILASDMREIEPFFDKLGKWHKSLGLSKSNSDRLFDRIYTHDRQLYDFLVRLGFSSKFGSFDKVFQLLSNDLHRYFVRGLIDADGCIGYYKGNAIVQIASGHEQNWSSLESFCKRCGVAYKITRRVIRKLKDRQHKMSTFIVSGGRANVIKFLSIVYDGALDERLYLSRKFNRFLYIKQICEDREALKKKRENWVLIDPLGEAFVSKGLKQACKQHNLCYAQMCAVANRQRSHHKGWLCYNLDDFDENTFYNDRANLEVYPYTYTDIAGKKYVPASVREFCRRFEGDRNELRKKIREADGVPFHFGNFLVEKTDRRTAYSMLSLRGQLEQMSRLFHPTLHLLLDIPANSEIIGGNEGQHSSL